MKYIIAYQINKILPMFHQLVQFRFPNKYVIRNTVTTSHPFCIQAWFCKAAVTPGLRSGYDPPATEKCWNRWLIVERTYDWSHRS